jgi:hypothetical protein
MTGQELFNYVGGALLTILGWLGRQLWDAVAELKKDVKQLEIDLPTSYASKDDMTARFDRLEDLLHRLLDNKQDKGQ